MNFSLSGLLIMMAGLFAVIAPFVIAYSVPKKNNKLIIILLVCSFILCCLLAYILYLIAVSKGGTLPLDILLTIVIFSFIPFYLNLIGYGIGRLIDSNNKSDD